MELKKLPVVLLANYLKKQMQCNTLGAISLQLRVCCRHVEEGCRLLLGTWARKSNPMEYQARSGTVKFIKLDQFGELFEDLQYLINR